MADEAVRAGGDQPAMRRHQSKRTPEGCQAQAPNHNPDPLEKEPAGVQPSGVETAGTKYRSTERAEIGGDPYGDAPTHQCGRSANAEQDSRPEAKQPDTKSDHPTRF